MTSKKNQPFTISRSDSGRSSFSFLDKSLSGSFDENNAPLPKIQNSFLSKQGSLVLPQASYKNCYNIFKTDANIMPELLEQYSQANLYYRDEEFTQQAESFIAKVTTDKRIPKEFKARFPLYQILISICKVFMLNEYEIVVFSCTLDHCTWKIDEVVYPDEGHLLEEFPANFGVEVTEECKRFIMYLLIITFSIKQYLNDKSEIDPIQAYCEKICNNFQALFNRWTRLSVLQKFNYSPLEINRKFKNLSKREYNDQIAAPKDYNLIVDNIMTLTGSYNSKSKVPERTAPQPLNPAPTRSPNILLSQRSQVFQDLLPQGFIDPKAFNLENCLALGFDKGFSRSMTLQSEDENPKPQTSAHSYNRQGSLSQLLTNFSVLKRQESFELTDKAKKKLKLDNVNSDTDGGIKDSQSSKPAENVGFTSNISSQNEGEDLFNLAMPTLSKKASNVSQAMPEEMPTFSRFNSNLSFLYDKEK